MIPNSSVKDENSTYGSLTLLKIQFVPGTSTFCPTDMSTKRHVFAIQDPSELIPVQMPTALAVAKNAAILAKREMGSSILKYFMLAGRS